MTLLNMQVPASDLNGYLIRKIAFDNLCSFSDYIGGYIGLFFGALLAGLGWHWFRRGWPQSPAPTETEPGKAS